MQAAKPKFRSLTAKPTTVIAVSKKWRSDAPGVAKLFLSVTPATLYSPRDKERKMPDYAVLHDKERNSYVGCLRWNCAETGADRAGFWYPPGKVMRVPSPIEMALQSGSAVCVGDLSNSKEATKGL